VQLRLTAARRALGLPRTQQWAAARALGWLVLAQAALVVLPYTTVCRLVARVTQPPRASSLTAAECATAIARAGALFPPARCLARAIAAECMLGRAGRAPRIVIGVGFDERRTFEAHAWLECDGTIVTGAGEAARFAPLSVGGRSSTADAPGSGR
jgi:transglutaminase superfamily protein